MAITITAPRSSIIANDNKNIFSPTGTLFPNTDKTANENAISVAVGIAQPGVADGLSILIKR